MTENEIIKSCYFCDYPYDVPADYEEKVDEYGVYHSWIKKYKDLWVCMSCTSSGKLGWTDFRIQENGECCVCLEEEIFKANSKLFFVLNKSERNIPAQKFIKKGFAINDSNNLVELDKNYWATIDEKMGGLTN